MSNLERVLDAYVEQGIVEHILVRAGRDDRILLDTCRGDVDTHSLFDMASITKIMVTTTLALMALDQGLLRVEDSVSGFYDTDRDFTVGNLLTHTTGIGHVRLDAEGNSYDNIGEWILGIPCDFPTGSQVRYSCRGFILLGKILEKVFGKRLDMCFDELIAPRLGLTETSFLPNDRQRAVNANLCEELRGMVNDNNCRFLGGVAGNAGLFSCMEDVTKYARFLLQKGSPLISENTFDMAARNYTGRLSESRGLGFLYVDDRYPQTGDLFSDGAIGHCGHTGQSVFVDYRSGLFAIILSDATVSTTKKYGKEHYDEVMELRAQLHSAIRKDLENLLF